MIHASLEEINPSISRGLSKALSRHNFSNLNIIDNTPYEEAKPEEIKQYIDEHYLVEEEMKDEEKFSLTMQ